MSHERLATVVAKPAVTASAGVSMTSRHITAGSPYSLGGALDCASQRPGVSDTHVAISIPQNSVRRPAPERLLNEDAIRNELEHVAPVRIS